MAARARSSGNAAAMDSPRCCTRHTWRRHEKPRVESWTSPGDATVCELIDMIPPSLSSRPPGGGVANAASGLAALGGTHPWASDPHPFRIELRRDRTKPGPALVRSGIYGSRHTARDNGNNRRIANRGSSIACVTARDVGRSSPIGRRSMRAECPRQSRRRPSCDGSQAPRTRPAAASGRPTPRTRRRRPR